MKKLNQYQICARVRKGVESFAKATGYPVDLCGLCGIASHALAKAFRIHGYSATLVAGMYRTQSKGSHSWVESKDKIWDVTATQFKRGKVVVVDKKRSKAYKRGPEGWQSIDSYRTWGEQCPTWRRTQSILKRAKIIDG